MNEIDTALYNHLNVGTVTALATGGVWNTLAPQGTATPYVLFSKVSEVSAYSFGGTIANCLYLVKGVSSALYPAEAGSIDARVRDRLQNGTLSVDGWTLARCARETAVMYREGQSPAYWHAGAYYRIVADKT